MNHIIAEHPTVFDAKTWRVRRDPGQARWQVFREGVAAPVGFIEARRCACREGLDETQRVGLFLYGRDGQPLFTAKAGRDDGCLPHYENCLAVLAMHERRIDAGTTPAAQ
jgi:hypothetical protein